MKNIISLLLLTILMFSCKTSRINQVSIEVDYFKIEVEQNGKIIEENNNIIELNKEPFKLILTYYKTDHLFVSASWDKYYYDYPDEKNIFQCNDKDHFDECRFISIKTGSEDKFNDDKDIYVGDDSYQMVWFYDENFDWYRMDRGVTVKDGVIYASVTVENIYDMDKRDAKTFKREEYEYTIDKINQDIYMVFATNHYESGMEHPDELQREKFILQFK